MAPTNRVQRMGGRAQGKRLRAAAVEATRHLLPLMVRLREEGQSLSEIAKGLNALGHRTRGGKAWRGGTVWRVLRRAGVK